MIRYISINILLISAYYLNAQSFSGSILDMNEHPLQGALAVWMNSTTGGATDEHGMFTIKRTTTDKFLILSYTGFQKDTIEIPDDLKSKVFHLKEGITLNEVQVQTNRDANTFSRLNPLNIEGLEQKEFKKAACCSLSESFSTSNAVDVSYTNAATGSKEIQFLGLRGLYTQFLVENRPAFQGILSNSGYDLIPGTWLDRVNIQKGASSAIYGAQSMAGAINVELKKPHEDYPFFVNAFQDFHGRLEGNLHLNKKWNETTASGLYVNATTNTTNRDHNGDSFQDDAKVDKLNGLFRNIFFGNTWEGQLNEQALFERITSGQLNTANPYLITQEITHADLSGKLGYVNFKKENQSIGSIYDFSFSKIHSIYGNKLFDANEKRIYIQAFYNHPFGDGLHEIILGPTFVYNESNESFQKDSIAYKEIVGGGFIDYTFRNNKKLNNSLTITLSQRLDKIDGENLLYIPRFNIRYLFAEDWTLRTSVGRGYRFPRIFSDESALFASSKTWNFRSIPKLETSWNTGINIVGKPYINGQELTINLDAYYTWFQNQVIIDLDNNYSRVDVYNLSGNSYAFQTIATVSYPVYDHFQFKLGGKFTNSKSEYDKGLRDNLMIPRYRGLASLDFESPDKHWLWNLSANYIGKMRLADKENVSESIVHEHTGYSNPYVMLQTQLNYFYNEWEFYAGIENITNYTQHEAIIDPFNPNGSYFNAAEVYAPVSGIKPFVGFRLKIRNQGR